MDELRWERDGKSYTFQECQEQGNIRISVGDSDNFLNRDQVVLPLSIWNAMAYGFVAKEKHQEKNHEDNS